MNEEFDAIARAEVEGWFDDLLKASAEASPAL